jgi:hypothetical protein
MEAPAVRPSSGRTIYIESAYDDGTEIRRWSDRPSCGDEEWLPLRLYGSDPLWRAYGQSLRA